MPQLLPALSSWSELIKHFYSNIKIVDLRSRTIPTEYVGLIIGITLDKIQVRRNNDTSEWMPIKHSKISFYPLNN